MDAVKALLVALLVSGTAVGCGSESEDEEQVTGCGQGLWRCLPAPDDAGGEGDGDAEDDAGAVEDDDALTCDQQTELDYGVCHIFSGPSAADNQASFCALGIKGTTCPDDVIGRCDLSSVGANPQGYVQLHYVSATIADAAASQALCEAGQGTWSP